MTVAKKSGRQLRYERNENVRQAFHEYMEVRRYPRIDLIARDANIYYETLITFNNGSATVSHATLDKLEEFMKNN